jgi:eukaryotic-like serine/threonine-protein kinase
MSEAAGPSEDSNLHDPESQRDGTAPLKDDAETTLDSAALADSESNRENANSKFVGHYRLLRKLGEGGMGQVWLAEQTAPVHRQVALKLVKAGLYGERVLQRFFAERQSLAIMNHPSIAKIFDAGTTPDGQPYFVMEYVPGLPITTYCDQKRLTIRERLELFRKACQGVQHAHQKAIMHRDLKPANILVVEIDGKPTPRIIDFGLAKEVVPPAPGETLFTQMGAFLGTPGYMSPEQADPTVEDVDTRTDVYSLGVILYELLTGSLPLDPKDWRSKPFDKVLRQLREEDPIRPSTKVSGNRQTSSAVAEKRQADVQHLVGSLRGDLDWITMKAIERDRTRRYGTPSELAADIERYLHDQPVEARPASLAYRTKKYIQRHKFGVAAISAVALLLIAFAAFQAIQLRRVTRERDRADRITKFMTGMFKVPDPSEAKGNSVTAREILDKASKDIDKGLEQDPTIRAELSYAMASTYLGLGLYGRAQVLLERALEIQQRELGPNDPKTMETMNALGWVVLEQGHFAEAEKMQRQVLETDRRVFGLNDKKTIAAMNDLGWTLDLEGRFAEADKLQRECLMLARRNNGPQDRTTLVAMENLSNTLTAENSNAEAEALFRQILDIRRRALGPDHPDTLRTMTALATTLESEGHHAEAEKLLRETVDIERRVLGPEHSSTLASLNSLAQTISAQGRYAEAETLQRQVLDAQRRTLGPEHPDTLVSMTELGGILRSEGRFSEAIKIQSEAVDIRRRVEGPASANTIWSLQMLALTLSHGNQYPEAQKLFRETIDTLSKTEGQPGLSDAWYTFGCAAALAGHRDEAFQYLQQAIEHGYNNPETMLTDDDLKSLRDDARFAPLVASARQRAGTKTP